MQKKIIANIQIEHNQHPITIIVNSKIKAVKIRLFLSKRIIQRL